ncbi:hypothetical protein EV649_4008 [Kribbella sp. VKM Ac-2569]|uniref:hypothetical protein n=1 Tax=Kribbella sp. VKM Ac-2569 TaxID=2512220 RepID=UPI0010DA1299|nr:hypothetical protein [Kribbella sp. VKM Ac-2569]RZT20855.1 hypothetical protein EV649_4008 [Kribbella sp. VKM Ac-2569]
MGRLRTTLTVLAAAGLAAAGATTATASPTGTTAACGLNLGSVTAGGDQTLQRLTASTPPAAGARSVVPNVYADGAVRMIGSLVNEATPTGSSRHGRVVLGDTMYQHWLELDKAGKVKSSELARIGGGWSKFVDHETSVFNDSATHPRTYEYALRADGVLFRWVVGDVGSWKAYGSAPGFASVKSMTLISKAAAYDTFLANTRGGALYTIRIPVNSQMRPIVTKVRSATWQGFESLVAAQCGNYGTVVVGIDKDTKSAYLYTFGHADGAKTSITGHGKVPGTFADPTYFRWAPPVKSDWLFGE